MLSPRLADSIGGVRTPADLLKLPIVSPSDPWWTIWFEAAGVSPEGLRDRPNTLLGAQSYEGSAAIAGQGVGMLTPAFFADELAEGRLLQPFDLICEEGIGYWLVYPEARRQSPKIATFRDWLLARLGAAASD